MPNYWGRVADHPPGQAPEIFAAVAEDGVVHLAGELDLSGVAEARAAFTVAAADRVGRDLLVDCSRLTFLDAAGLSALVGAQRACQAAGVDLVLVDPPACMTKLLGLVGLDQHFPVRWTREKR